MTPVIQTRGLTKEFRGGRGVRDVSLQVEPGQVFGFLGPNGAGKSTFVKMLVGLLTPTSGEAHVLGLPVGDLDARRRIGYLPELFRYQDWLSAEEVLRFHASLCKMPRQHAERRIQEVLRDVGLEGRSHERVRSYSKGMQQRLGLACALLPNPDVLFLDEPASALDPGGRREVRELLSRLRDRGLTVFLNTHLLEDVESICSEVALLIDGSIRAHGKVDDILNPEPVFEFTIAGWAPGMLESLWPMTSGLGIEIDVVNTDITGFSLLEAHLDNVEQAAWLNAQLVELGLSVYTIAPRKNRLESWFLTLTEPEGRESM